MGWPQLFDYYSLVHYPVLLLLVASKCLCGAGASCGRCNERLEEAKRSSSWGFLRVSFEETGNPNADLRGRDYYDRAVPSKRGTISCT
jgi:hypothetical protein